MITEDYVSFEMAKLLKEKGFNCPCRAVYSPKGVIKHYLKEEVYAHHLKGHKKLCPTLQMAMKWLRETYDVYIVPKKDFFGGFYTGRIYDGRRETLTDKNDYTACSGYNNYEEACEAAIKYCLENLI